MAYLLLTLSSLISVFTLAKDWKAHSAHWRRGGVITLIVAVYLFGCISIHKTNKQHAIDNANLRDENKQRNEKIDGLEGTLRDVRSEQKATAEASAQSISHLTDRVIDLQTKLYTADLQQEADALRKDLQNTQQAMAPAPKAKLFARVGTDIKSTALKPTITATFPVIDDNVTIQFDFVNASSADALEGATIVFICDSCILVKELEGWDKVPGAPLTQRNNDFSHYYTHSVSQTFTLIIHPPLAAKQFDLAFDYRCRTCIQEPTQRVTVKLTR